MKNFRFLASVAIFALLSVSSINAQQKGHGNWREKMRSEKIAFITMELNLTPEEAQVFWPVYNQITNDKQATQRAMMKAYREMLAALQSDTATDKEIDALLDKYLKARQAHRESGKGDVEKYRKVLPSKKVAKLYVAEEKFRRQRIRNMRNGQQGGQRPEPRR